MLHIASGHFSRDRYWHYIHSIHFEFWLLSNSGLIIQVHCQRLIVTLINFLDARSYINQHWSLQHQVLYSHIPYSGSWYSKMSIPSYYCYNVAEFVQSLTPMPATSTLLSPLLNSAGTHVGQCEITYFLSVSTVNISESSTRLLFQCI